MVITLEVNQTFMCNFAVVLLKKKKKRAVNMEINQYNEVTVQKIG